MQSLQKLLLLFVLFISTNFYLSAQLHWEATPLNITGDTIGVHIIGEVMDLAVDSVNDRLIIGGDFHTVNNEKVCNVISWNGTEWDSLPGLTHDTTGISDLIEHLAVYKGKIYAAGNIRIANDTNFYQLAMWTGTQWQPVPGFDLSGSNGPKRQPIVDMAVYNGELYVAGIFDSLPGLKTKGIARWNGMNWNTVGSTTLPSPFSIIFSLHVLKNELYVGGVEVIANQQIAKWNGLQWDSVSLSKSTFEGVSLISSYRERIYATDFPFGDFLTLNGSQLDTLKPPFATNGKHPGVVTSTGLFQDQFFIGGFMGYPGGLNTWGVVSWNDTTWTGYGEGIVGNINAFAVYKNELYIGGGFTQVDTMAISNLVKLTDTSNNKPPTGQENYAHSNNQLQLYPNPASTQTTLIIGSKNSTTNNHFIRIYTSCGKRIQQLTTQSKQVVLDLSDLAKGIYIVECSDENGSSFFRKLIRE